MPLRTAAAPATCPFTGHTAKVAVPAPGAGAVSTLARPSRRTLLAAALGLAATKAIGGLGAPVRAMAGARRATKGMHGKMVRGLNVAAQLGRDKEARFGLMFKTLPAYTPSDTLLKALAARMNDQKPPLSDVKNSDVQFDQSMPAGYIYFGQFIDHDLTRDVTPLLQQQQDPTATVNYDTPKFDLGSVYGGGPTANPELYDAARPGYLKVNPHDGMVDLPRDEVGAAFLGDPRNDENLIVAQLHTVFLRLHNRFRDQGMSFEQARQQTRWHFQWLVVNDYLHRIVGKDMVASVLGKSATGTLTANTKFYRPRNAARPYMPIEFAGAAYRFGHSMIRAEYEVQDGHTVPIFGADGYEDLRGNRQIPHTLWIDWNYFFDIPGLSAPDDRNMARKIDTQISLPLYKLPPTVVAPTTGAILALAERNLLRGKRIGLPAGQDVAVAMGITPLTNAQLGLTEAGWNKKAPLWFYILKEAELLGGGRLGPVGGRIVAEVLLGLLALDKNSYFNARPGFSPGAGFKMGDLILKAGAFDPRGVPGVLPPEEPELPEDPNQPVELEPVELEPDEVILPEATEPIEGVV